MPTDDDLVTLTEAARALGRRVNTVCELRGRLTPRGERPGRGGRVCQLFRLGDVREAAAALPREKKGYAAFNPHMRKRAG